MNRYFQANSQFIMSGPRMDQSGKHAIVVIGRSQVKFYKVWNIRIESFGVAINNVLKFVVQNSSQRVWTLKVNLARAATILMSAQQINTTAQSMQIA